MDILKDLLDKLYKESEARKVGLFREPWHDNRQVLTFYTQPGLKAMYEALKERVHNEK